MACTLSTSSTHNRSAANPSGGKFEMIYTCKAYSGMHEREGRSLCYGPEIIRSPLLGQKLVSSESVSFFHSGDTAYLDAHITLLVDDCMNIVSIAIYSNRW